MMCLIISKLRENLREKSNGTVLNIKRRHLRDPDFADLIHFVVDEATLGNKEKTEKKLQVNDGS